MNPFLFNKRYSSFKKITGLIIGMVILILCMPMIAVMAVTHSSSIQTAEAVSTVTSYPGDLYAWGNCTWWVSMLKSQMGEPIPNSWGNAATWASRAQADGYVVDHTPSYGAIMQIADVDHGLGHVAFVESVDAGGYWTISEMNVVGLDVVDTKTLPPLDALNFNFIHNP